MLVDRSFLEQLRARPFRFGWFWIISEEKTSNVMCALDAISETRQSLVLDRYPMRIRAPRERLAGVRDSPGDSPDTPYTWEDTHTRGCGRVYTHTTVLRTYLRWLRSDAARLINDSYNISLSRAPRLARYLAAETTKKPANINIYFMFYICFPHPRARACVCVISRRVFHEIDDANAMTSSPCPPAPTAGSISGDSDEQLHPSGPAKHYRVVWQSCLKRSVHVTCPEKEERKYIRIYIV